jgi:hypothetical protein
MSAVALISPEQLYLEREAPCIRSTLAFLIPDQYDIVLSLPLAWQSLQVMPR